MKRERNPQREFIVGAVLEFIGIVALAFRFGAKRGGLPLTIFGAIIVLVAIVVQVGAFRSARRQHEQ